MIWYLPPAFTLAKVAPAWILWAMTGISMVLPVSGSIVWGW